MTKHFVSIAAALAVALSTGSAHALNKAQTLAATPIYITGGGAADRNLENTVKNLFTSASVDTYQINGSKSNFFAVSGTLTAASATALGLANPINVVVYKRTLGAAFTSTTVASTTPIAHLDISQLNEADPTNANAATTRLWNVTGSGTGIGAGTGLVNKASDAGYTDTPVLLFSQSVNVPAGITPPTRSSLNKLVQKPINAALHGIAVTKALRDALQQQQGLLVGDESEANVPSLSSAAIASIYRGRITRWTQLVHNGARLQIPAGYSPDVYVVPRSPGAAIQASVNARILATSNPTAAGPAPQNLDFPPYVFEAALPADTDVILNGLNNGSEFNWNDGDGNVQTFFPEPGVKYLAIGNTSTERNAGTQAGLKDQLNYRFIKIDGVAPTVRNGYNGTYPLTLEASIVYRGPSAQGPLTGFAKTFIDFLVTRLGQPSVLGANNQSFFHGYGQTGYLALTTNGHSAATFDPNNPVTPYTYSPNGTAPDIGKPAVLDSNEVLAPDLITK